MARVGSKEFPARIYLCGSCGYYTKHRWVLANHIERVHGYRKGMATAEAKRSEYLLNPVHMRNPAVKSGGDKHKGRRRPQRRTR